MLYMFCSNHVDDKVKAAIVEDTDVSKVLVAALKAHSGDAKVARWCIAALAYATQNKSTHALLLKDKKTLCDRAAPTHARASNTTHRPLPAHTFSLR